jgi:hypothetical protein
MVGMGANLTQPSEASVDDFVAAIEDKARRRDARELTALVASVTGVEPVMWGQPSSGSAHVTTCTTQGAREIPMVSCMIANAMAAQQPSNFQEGTADGSPDS